jgi:demethylmenaquinone methyltransferase/2-methoxy-6-polyprenyl-1,4-benzoquinol methylase/phosphoethanolamine N-methyltransferase
MVVAQTAKCGLMGRVNSPSTDGIVIRWARFYDFIMKVITLGRESKFRRKILEIADLQAGNRVLDVGCGTGTLTLLAADQVAADIEAYGIDPAPEMIARAQLKASRIGNNAKFTVGVIEALDFPDKSMDVVFCTLVFHHLPDDKLQQTALREIRRVLVAGGRLILVDFGAEKQIERLCNAMHNAGFNSTEVKHFGPPALFAIVAC